MKKTVLVCGDLVWDTHIARLPFGGHGYYEPHPHTQLVNRHGGAWYLSDVIIAASDAFQKFFPTQMPEMNLSEPTRASHDVIEGRKCPDGVAKGFSVWQWMKGTKKPAIAKLDAPKSANEKPSVIFKWPEGIAEPGAWRIKEFLGCRAATWAGKIPKIAINNEPKSLDLLVIDDLGLGFATNENHWPKCLLGPPKNVKSVIVKATPPFHNKLWKTLLASEWAGRVTVIVAANALRDAGADITRDLSWDRTLEDIEREFRAGSMGPALRECRRIVVTLRRSGAAVFSRVPQSPEESARNLKRNQFERLVFDAAQFEDNWSANYAGEMFGTGSVMTAAFACHELMSIQPSTHLTVGFGLAAARELMRRGATQNEKEFSIGETESKIFVPEADGLPWTAFRSAFPRQLLDEPVLQSRPDKPALPSLLTDAVGSGPAFLTIAAEEIVRYGPDDALASAPQLRCGKYLTVDREEIETLNSVRHLIEEYAENKDERPLSLAVFGAPGSGKSFAITQVAEEVFQRERGALTFNLSEFRSIDDLHEAFHEVRDKSVQGQLPLVFWDEFDSKVENVELAWLKEFLVPMQDAKFQGKSTSHPFGKCIFIFAGGTSHTFQKFNRSQDKTNIAFVNAKGPDFVSRLRGYVNIKGPNPSAEESDGVYIIRRGLALRFLIQKHHPRAIHPVTNELVIHPNVLAAFLTAKDYHYGNRSMEAIVSLCQMRNNRHFGPSELPPAEVIHLHVSNDFSDILKDNSRYRLKPEDVSVLAEKKHNTWKAQKVGDGYIWGPKRDDKSQPPTHPFCKDFRDLPKAVQDLSRLPARLALLRLEGLGFKIVPRSRVKARSLTSLPKETWRKLWQTEHRRWTREKLLKGVAYCKDTYDELGLHKDICKFASLHDQEAALDKEIMAAIFEFLKENDLALVKGGKSAPNH